MHNNIRNNKFAYDWAIETIEYCNEHNIKLTIVTIGLDDTLKIKNISEIFKLAHKYNAINRINIYRKAADRNDECELSYDVLMEFLEWASKKQTVMDLMDPLFNSIAGGEDIVVDASHHLIFHIPNSRFISASTSSAEYTLPALISSMPFSISALNCSFVRKPYATGSS